MDILVDNPGFDGGDYQESADEAYWNAQGYIVEEVEDYLLREWKENMAFRGHDPYTDDELDVRSGKGEIERILNRSDAVMERAEGVRINKDIFKLDCARDTVEKQFLREKLDVSQYEGGEEFVPEWIPEFNPTGWLKDNPISVKLGSGAAVLTIASIESHLHERRISISVKKDNGNFVRYLIGASKGKIWISVASNQRKGVVFIPYSLTHFWLDITGHEGKWIALLNAYRKVSSGRDYWLFQVSGLNTILNILVSISSNGELYANVRPEAK